MRGLLRVSPTTVALVIGIGLVLAHGTVRGATVTVTPSAISNYFRGYLTLQITGLTNGESVFVERVADLNTNGLADSYEPVLEAFWVTDGRATVIAGITNLNVPGDTTGTDGTIVAQLNMWYVDLTHTVGRYVYRVSSPGRFTNSTTFAVTNSALPSTVTGQVRSGSTNVPYAIVVLFDARHGTFKTGVICDSNGNYSVTAPEGNYLVWAFKPGYVTPLFSSPVSVGASGSYAVNPTLNPATTYIAGQVVDASTGAGIPGLLGFAGAETGSGAVAWTGPNGAFTFHVTPDWWNVSVDSFSAARAGYVAYDEGADLCTTNGPVTGFVGPFYRAVAMVYGKVTLEDGTPVPGVDLYSEHQDRGLIADGWTDGSGWYTLGVVDGQWWIQPDPACSVPGYVFSQGSSVSIASNTAVRLDFFARPATATINVTVKLHDGTPVPGLSVWASTWGMTNNYSSWGDTDENGQVALPAFTATWMVGVDSGDLERHGYQPPANQFVTIPPTNQTLTFVVYPLGHVTPPRLRILNRFNGGCTLEFTTEPNVTYEVQYTTNLNSTWTPFYTCTGSGAPQTVTDWNASTATRFYRVRAWRP